MVPPDPAAPAHESDNGAAPPPPETASQHKPRKRPGHGWTMLRSALAMIAFIGLIVGGVVFSVMALTGKTMTLPTWLVDAAERQIKDALPPSIAVDLGAVELLVDDGWVPRLRVQNLRLLGEAGATIVTLPEARVVFDGAAFLKGQLRPSTIRLSAAEVSLRRESDGRFNLDFGAGFNTRVDSFPALLNEIEAAFAVPALQRMQSLQVTGLNLKLTDVPTGQVWQVGDGKLAIANRANDVAAELSFGLSGAVAAGDVQISLTTDKTDLSASISTQVTDIPARDLAVQVPPLAFLQVLDAPLSGMLTTAIDQQGQVSTLDAALEIGPGAITPNAQTAAFAFQNASLALSFTADSARLNITRLAVQSDTATFAASGHVLLHDSEGRPVIGAQQDSLPTAFIAQLALQDIGINPEGEFATPVAFGAGALDLRLTLDPFRVEIGQLALSEADQHLQLSGWAEGRSDGWHAGFDVGLDQIAADRLVAFWPLRLVPKTRAWLAANVQQGTLSHIHAAVRLTPGQDPKLHLGYDFREAEVRFLRSLPPITLGTGYAVLEGKRYVMVLDQGIVTAPLGGDIDVAGSVFEIADITQRPNIAEIALNTSSSVTAALSLLDLPPFGFMTKADRPVDLGEGQANVATRLTIPLGARVQLSDVNYHVKGQITDFVSTKLVPGRRLQAPVLALTATPVGMEITGEGRLGKLPFDMTYTQGFAASDRGRARVTGVVTISPDALDDLNIALPDGFLRGQGTANVTLDLRRGAPASLTLDSRLAGIGLAVPDLGWSKPRDARGNLTLEATLSTPPVVTALELNAAGLRASGEITVREGGGLREARFSRLSVDDWFDAQVTLTGQGRGASSVAVTGGTIDLRRIPDRDSGNSTGNPFSLRLDRLTVSDTIAFTGFRGEFTPRGGLNGSFSAGVNGQGAVIGTVVPSANGPAVRIQSEDAGTVMAAAGVFGSARGGTLDLQLSPRSQKGVFDGRAELSRLRVRNASVLAELLNAISVVGLLEQLNGSGIVFNDAEVDFLLTPRAIEISRGSAIGASLGVSMAGVYQTANRQLNVQGVISPIYIVNGVGAVLTRRGEGLFGFNYRMSGSADDPQITVNPLSILTPGMFRDLFRRPPPVLGETE